VRGGIEGGRVRRRLAIVAGAAIVASGCGGGSGNKPVQLGTATAGPYAVVLTTPTPPQAGAEIPFEVTITQDGAKVEGLAITLVVSRPALGPSKAVVQAAMTVCSGCGAYRHDAVLADPGEYLIAFSVPQPANAAPVPLQFTLQLP
jgi:hypothetical protein